MKIYSWNVNGIRAVQKKGLLEPFMDHHQPDILCLQETKAQEEQIDLELPKYEQYYCSAVKKGYSGTAIFTKIAPDNVICGLPPHIIAKYNLEDSYGDSASEGRVTTLQFEHFYLVTVYTPNAKDELARISVRQEWDKAFLEYVSELESELPVVFTGDLNVAHQDIDLARPKENRGKKGFSDEERGGFANILSAGFTDSLRHFTDEAELYTWWSHFARARERNVGWRIDYIMVSNQLVDLLKSARIHPDVLGSDHCPVSVEIAL